MERSDKIMTNDMYFRQYGKNTAEPHEYISDPPPYEGPSIRGASFLPEAPSPAPITGTGVVMEPGVVMGDFLDDRIDGRIDDLYTRIQKLENIVDKCCDDDDEFQDVQEEEPIIQTQNGDYFTDEEFLRALRVFEDKEKGVKKLVSIMKGAYPNYKGINAKRVRDALYLIRSGKTPEVTMESAKKFDYKTKGWIMINVKIEGLFNISHPAPTDFKKKKYLKELMEKHKLPNTRHIDIVKITGTKFTTEIIESMKKISKYGFWKASTRSGLNGGIIETNSDLERIIRGTLAPRDSSNWRHLNGTIPGRGCEIYLAPGASLKLIKEKMDQGYEIEFEDKNDKREVEAMQGGGYRRRNTLRKSRKRNTRRKSRKRNTRRKSRKRNTRRKSRKRSSRRKSKKK
jgi:hypothetical protein